MEWPPVTLLVVHLPGQHNVVFNENEDLVAVVERASCQRTTLMPTLHITFKMRMGGTWCMWTSLLIMFGKFEKKFGQFDNKEKKLWANVFHTSRCW
jgi:hypothetical protein